MDQISLFAGGRITDYAGAFVQGTFDGIASAFHLDNTDLRLTSPFSVGDTELRLGLDINNGPTVQDPFNSSYAWGYPYVSSVLVLVPTAQPLLAGGLIGNSLGATVYAWYDRSLYLEAGLYNTYGPSLLSYTGNAYGPGATANPAPYCAPPMSGTGTASPPISAGFSCIPTSIPRPRPSPAMARTGKTATLTMRSIAATNGSATGRISSRCWASSTTKTRTSPARSATGSASQQDNSLNQIRANVTYYYQQTYGATVAWQKTWGSPNPLLYTPAPLTGSANGKPNSNAFIFEADYVPFGKANSWAGPFVNLKLGCNTRCIRSSTVARRTTTASAEQRATTTRSTCSPG